MTIDSAIVVAFISLCSAVLVALINNVYNQRSMKKTQETHYEEIAAQNQQAMAMIEYKIGELTKNVEKHNNVIERTYALENKTEVFAEKIKVINNRIADLEEMAKK